jgi:catechol 2,3-dioxygenase-like lactoylglutathione lyase family enzyme
MLNCLDHVTIVVRDVEAATQSYQRLLGVPPLWRGTHPEARTEAALFALDNSLIELSGPAADAPDADETEGLRTLLETRGEGLTTLSFGTTDAALASKVLRERGVRATPPQDGAAVGQDGQPRRYRLVELSPRATRALPVSLVERPASLFVDRKVAPADSDGQPGLAREGRFHALDHVVVRSADLTAAIALYGTAMGLRLALDTHFAGTRMLFFRVGGVTLEIVEDLALTGGDELHGVAYRTTDLTAAHARLAGAGFAVDEPRAGHKPGTEVFVVRDQTHGVPTLVLRDPTRDRTA